MAWVRSLPPLNARRPYPYLCRSAAPRACASNDASHPPAQSSPSPPTAPQPPPPPFKFPLDVKSLSDRDRQRLRLWSKSIPLAGSDVPLRVLHEDADLLCVDKPAFIKMHPAHRFEGGTLLNRAIGHVRRNTLSSGEEEPHIHVLHRLDMHTTGVVCFAKSPLASKSMHTQFREATVRKEYLAIVDGVSPKRFHVDAAIQRATWLKFAREIGTRPDSKSAQTSFVTLSSSERHSLLHCVLHTGRTIRLHTAHTGHPVVGDSLYNDAERAMYEDMEALQLAAHDESALAYAHDEPLRAGLKLHSWRLSFQHPRNGAPIVVCSPPSDNFDLFCHQSHLTIPDEDAHIQNG